MSNELRITQGVAYTNGALSDTVTAATLSVTQNALAFQGDVISVGSGAEADITTTNITTLGWLYLKNLDATNFVTWGPKSGGSMVALGRLTPGESALLRIEPGTTLRWKADTAAVKVLTKFYND